MLSGLTQQIWKIRHWPMPRTGLEFTELATYAIVTVGTFWWAQRQTWRMLFKAQRTF